MPFKNGRPDFSQWSKGEVEFDPGVLDGSNTDFLRVYEQIKEAAGLPSNNAAKELLRQRGLTPHHFSDTVIQLIPTDLHANIPHIGSASDLRRNV
uniref:HNH endonuclease n=1 Tax=Thioclava sp. GXIMD4216 TaxID=3131929 RepID=UPI00403FF945